jgi:YidC/Oxa1 family membrane protein insertase
VASAATAPTTGPSVASSGPSVQAGFTIVRPTSAEDTRPVRIGSDAADDPTWPMQLSLDPLGASVNSVTLNAFKRSEDFKRPVKDRRLYEFEQPYSGRPDSQPLATRSLTINGQSVSLDGLPWTLESLDDGTGSARHATYSLTISNNGSPALKVTKTFTIVPKTDPSKGYEVGVDYALENLSDQPLSVKAYFNGPTMPPRESSRPPDRQVIAGYRDDSVRDIEVVTHPVESFRKDNPTIDLTHTDKGKPAGWAGASSVYFSALVLPTRPGSNGAEPGDFIAKVTATQADITNENIEPEDRDVLMAFETTDVKVAPHKSASLPMSVYLGPRWREVLDQGPYTQFPRHYDASLVVKTGFCSFCTFDWLIVGLVWLLKVFHFALRDWGLSIIALVCIVRLILHPITKRSQIQMLKMGKMGPELEKLKKKYGDDKEEFAKAQMKLMKEQGMGPLLGCLPMFLQTPIWIALYSALQTTFELRQAPFLWGFTWIKDLAKPDYLIHFGHSVPVPILGQLWPHTWHFDGVNILPILLAVVFYGQQKLQPKPAAVTPEQQQQQKMMQWMTLLFPLFLYSGPSGLNLYILTSSSIGIMESKIIRDHIKQREEAEKAGRVIVDAKPTREGKRLARDRGGAASEPAKRTGLAGWWAEIQDKVEQARQQQKK